MRRPALLVIGFVVLLGLLAAVVAVLMRGAGSAPPVSWTPAPFAGTVVVAPAAAGSATPTGAAPAWQITDSPGLPVATATGRPVQARPTATPVLQPALSTATPPLPPPQTVLSPTPPPTADEPMGEGDWVTITDGAVLQAIEAGMAAQAGVILEDADVVFEDGRMRLSADRLAYGPIDVRDLVIVGRLTAVEGRLRFDAESIAPRTFVTTLIPAFANQALATYTSQWSISDVRIRPGKLIVRIG